MKEEKFARSRKPSHKQVFGEFWNLRGQHNREEKKQKTKKPQIMCLTTAASGEVAQVLVTTTSQRGLDREVRAA